ncbi:MAG: ATP-binding protein [Planctomycetota bacterium]
MITRLEALNFRSLRDVSQVLAPFQTLVGPNGSGKSSFLDVVGFLGDLLRAGLLKSIFGDDGVVPARAADPAHLCWMGACRRFELAVELKIPKQRLDRLPNGKDGQARYEIAVDVGTDGKELTLAAETLWLTPPPREQSPPQRELFPSAPPARTSIVQAPGAHAPPGWRKIVSKTPSGNDYFQAETSGWNNPFRLGPTRSALANLPEDEERFPVATWVKRFLMEGVSRVALNSEVMRRPSPPGSPVRFRPDGANLPWAVEALRASSPKRFERWIEHVRTALPDVKDISTVLREEDRNRYLVIEYATGLRAASWVVSDGTLRMLALTLLAYLPDLEGVYLIEEPENGIHPRAIESVYQSLSSVYGAQVLCASHSPVVLGLARPADLLCFAKVDGATDIVRGDEHPRLRNWQGGVDLGTLFAAGVLG